MITWAAIHYFVPGGHIFLPPQKFKFLDARAYKYNLRTLHPILINLVREWWLKSPLSDIPLYIYILLGTVVIQAINKIQILKMCQLRNVPIIWPSMYTCSQQTKAYCDLPTVESIRSWLSLTKGLKDSPESIILYILHMLFYLVHYDGTPWVEQHVSTRRDLSCPIKAILGGSWSLYFVRPLLFSIIGSRICHVTINVLINARIN